MLNEDSKPFVCFNIHDRMSNIDVVLFMLLGFSSIAHNDTLESEPMLVVGQREN